MVGIFVCTLLFCRLLASRASNLERSQAGDWVSFIDFYLVDAGGTRAFAETRMQSGKLFTRALGQDFDRAVRIIADPSGDLQNVGFALDEPPEADALDAAADQETARREWQVGPEWRASFEIAEVRFQIAEVKISGRRP